jgi:hypothetical protein
MRIVSRKPRIPPSPWHRRHSPKPATASSRGYEVYRPCLRWEFGFACPFCLLHEVQVAPTGARGSRTFWIEHVLTSKESPDDRSEYMAIVYACARCNNARGSRPSTQDGAALLNPSVQSWSEHFQWSGHELKPITEDAKLTAEVYDINSPVKLGLREELERIIDENVRLLRSGPAMISELMADLDSLPSDRRVSRLQIISQLHSCLIRARSSLERLRAVPHDADVTCRCESPPPYDLPAWYVGEDVDS